MLHKKVNKYLSVLVAVIIAFSCFSVNAFALDDDIVFSTSSINLVCSSSDFKETATVPTTFRSYINQPAYSFSILSDTESLKLFFDFSFLDSDVSKYKNYKIDFPLVLCLISNKVSFSDLNIYFHILYKDGSTSEYIVSPEIFENISSSSRPVYDSPFSFVISGNKLLNIKESYFLFDCSALAGSTCYFGLKKDSVFTFSKYSLDYNPLFDSSLNWVSDIFDIVRSSFALVVICIGFPLCAFSFILLKRLLRS